MVGAKALHARLAAVTGITNLVPKSRIRPINERPSGTAAAITYQEISGESVQLMAGNSGLANPHFQINCLAETYGEAQDVAEQVRIGIIATTAATIGGVVVYSMKVLDHRDDSEPPRSGEERGVHNVSLDVSVWHAEATA